MKDFVLHHCLPFLPTTGFVLACDQLIIFNDLLKPAATWYLLPILVLGYAISWQLTDLGSVFTGLSSKERKEVVS